MKKTTVLASIVALATMAPMTAQAAILDFTNSLKYGSVSGAPVAVVLDQGITVTLQAFETVPIGSPTALLRQNSAGIGVDLVCAIGCGIEDPNEVGLFELLFSGFAPPIHITRIQVQRLFNSQFDNETAEYNINNSGWVPVGGAASGIVDIAVNAPGVTSLQFRGPNLVSDFAVAQIEFQPVPEPGSLLLMGGGLLVIARRFVSRRTRG